MITINILLLLFIDRNTNTELKTIVIETISI